MFKIISKVESWDYPEIPRTVSMIGMAIHVVAEFLGVDAQKISRVKSVKEILDRVISKSKLNTISCNYHQFNPHGVTCVYLLKSSHLSVHTWPEYSYLSFDIFSCDKDEKTLKAFELLKKEFSPKLVKKKIWRHELYEKITNNKITSEE